MHSIRPLQKTEISLLKDFPPHDWNLDLPQLMTMHYDRSYFYPVVATMDERVMGCGIAMIHGTISWLGTIIVLSEFRNRGIGTAITQHLMNTCKQRGCKTQVLIASELGEPIYGKLGFVTTSQYDMYSRSSEASYPVNENIRCVQADDDDAIKLLDERITGEHRFSLIEHFLTTAIVYCGSNSREVRGVYFPDFGSGLVLANDEEAGIELMKNRLLQKKTAAVVPSANATAKQWLEREGFQYTRSLPRMVFGEEARWHPQKIYNRATGYCG